MYDYAPVAPGDTVRVDDDATLMLVLSLSKRGNADA